MPTVLKRNAISVLALAALFWWSFMHVKHSPALRTVIPFGDDPYDAVGSYGVIVGMLSALLSLFRAFRYYRTAPSKIDLVYLVRSQEAVVLAIFITLAADVIAMARHPAIWIGAASRDSLIAILGGLAVVTAFVQFLICTSQERFLEREVKGWKRVATAALLVMLVLSLYPEKLIDLTATHLLTVLAGATILFAPMRTLLNTLVPNGADNGIGKKTSAWRMFSTSWQRWVAILILGAMIGALAFAGEASEGAGTPALGRLVFVGSVFVGLGLCGIVIAYVFLGEPLGLQPRS
jgi:hypothetical protein